MSKNHTSIQPEANQPNWLTYLQQLSFFGLMMMVIPLLVVFILIGISVDGGRVTSTEASLFRLINGLPNFLTYPMILFQYAGLLGVPALCAGVAVVYRRYLLAALLLLIMPAKLSTEHVIKANFQRERPKVYIPEAILRGDVQASGLSFVSGHATIVFAIATLVTPFVSKPIRIGVWTIAGLCIFARVYLGAHLPRDVFGGALVGTMIGLILLYLYSLGVRLHQHLSKPKSHQTH